VTDTASLLHHFVYWLSWDAGGHFRQHVARDHVRACNVSLAISVHEIADGLPR
jgi:hypothetical protein